MPNEPETYNGTEDSDGCPDRGRVIVSQSKIEILDQLFFKRDSAKIEPASRPLIEAIAATLRGNPELSLLEVAGHACGDSNARDISQSRADAVRGALVGLGVEGRRCGRAATAAIDRWPLEQRRGLQSQSPRADQHLADPRRGRAHKVQPRRRVR